MNTKHIKFEDIVIAILVLSNLIVVPFFKLGSIGTYYIIPTIFLFFLINDLRKGIIINIKSYSYFLFFFLWASTASLLAVDIGQAFQTQRRILVILLYIYPILSYSSKSARNLKIVCEYFVIVLVLLLILFFHDILNVNFYADNRSGFFFDPNTYGYYIFSGIFSAYILYIKSHKKLFMILFLLVLLSMCFRVLMITESRGGFVIFLFTVIPGVYFLLNNKNNMKIAYYLKGLFYIIIIIYSCIYIYDNLFQTTSIYHRFIALEERMSPRKAHFEEAIKVGMNNPIFGVGGGNYALQSRSFERGSFSHNGFTEAFANYGFIGLFIFLAIFYEYLVSLIKLSRFGEMNILTRNIHYLFLFSFITYNFFYVSYLTIEFMGIFYIFRIHLMHCSNDGHFLRNQYIK